MEEIKQNSDFKKLADGRWFLLTGILSAIFFIFFGIYELLFKSPLASWAQGIFQSVLKTSPQSLAQVPGQIANSESLFQKSIGDWLGLVPGSLGQIWDVVISPLGAFFGLLLVLLAFAFSRKNLNVVLLETISSSALIAKNKGNCAQV